MNTATVLSCLMLSCLMIEGRHLDRDLEMRDENHPRRSRNRRYYPAYRYEEDMERRLSQLEELSTHILKTVDALQEREFELESENRRLRDRIRLLESDNERNDKPRRDPYVTVVVNQSPCGTKNDTVPIITQHTNIPNYDPNRIWGVNPMPGNNEAPTDTSNRPVSLNTTDREDPAAEHGSITTEGPPLPESTDCALSIAYCCTFNTTKEMRDCFTAFGCLTTFTRGDACTTSSKKTSYDHIADNYGPK